MVISDLEFYQAEIGRTDGAPPVRSLLVRIDSDDGREGWGEAALPWRPGEAAAKRHALLTSLAGRSPFDVEELLDLDVLHPPALKAAIEMACWDLIGRTLEQPLCRLWGGEYRPGAPIAVRLPLSDPRRTAEVAWALAEHGYRTQVVTSSGQVDQDLETIAAVRARVGSGVLLRLDGQQGFQPQAARELCARLENDPVEFFLDPLETRDFFPLATLGRQTNVPLALGRAISQPADAFAAVRVSATPYLAIDLGRVGGMTRARQCACVAEAGGATALVAGGPSLGVATAAMLQLVASTPAFRTGSECDYHQLTDDVLVRPLTIAEGIIAVPREPGLGIDVDREKLEQYQVG